MTSACKIKANRENARASTGPKSARGRASSKRNALRHALSLPVQSDPTLSESVEALVHEIAGTDADAEMRDLARPVAEAQIDLRRVHAARHQLLSQALSHDARANPRENIPVIGQVLRPNEQVPIRPLAKELTTTPEGQHKLALILSQEAQRLARLDRYERRALSRRKFAIRAFDAAKRRRRP